MSLFCKMKVRCIAVDLSEVMRLRGLLLEYRRLKLKSFELCSLKLMLKEIVDMSIKMLRRVVLTERSQAV